MNDRDMVIRISRTQFRWAIAAAALVAVVLLISPVNAQKVQEKYDDKFKVADENGGIAITTSADGRYVYAAGKKGVIVSDDFGKTGTWVQTVRLK